ncbi:MAG: hypothetical protein ACI4TT_04040 [Christensenellales bacterium]
MSVKEVIKQVAILLQLNNLIDANLDDYENLDSQTKKDINIVVSCINEVLCDISTDYLMLETTETIEVKEGTFDLANLSKVFYKMISFVPLNEYKIEYNNLLVKDGKYKITYNYLPEIVGLDDNIVYDNRSTIYGLCYGVAKEYCLVCGNYSESEMWESKFISAMQIAVRKSGTVFLKQRRWI